MRVCALVILLVSAVPRAAQAGTIFFDTFSPQQAGWSLASPNDPTTGFLGWLNQNVNVASATLTVNAPVADPNGTLAFDLLGFNTLDGFAGCCTDILTLTINSTLALTASFTGGPATNSGFGANPSGATMALLFWTSGGAQPFGAEFGYRLTVPHALLLGTNTYTWSYSPLESRTNEAWGLDNVQVDSAAVPEPASLLLLGAGLAGLAIRRSRLRHARS